MAWIIALTLAGIVALLIALYKRALDEAAGVSSLMIMILLNDDVYKAQRGSLISFVTNATAKDAHELSSKVHSAMSELGLKAVHSSILLGTPGFLWKLKQNGGTL